MTGRIWVRGLEVYGYHGCSEVEREYGHRLIVTVEVEAEQRAGATDAIEDTIDYCTLAEIAAGVVRGPSQQTLEFLAERIADHVLARFDAVREVEVSLEKPAPPIPLVAAATGVRISRTREQGSPGA